MNIFTIETESNIITVYASAAAAKRAPNCERFSSEASLAKLAADWPTARLVEIWNSLPGQTPVKKFKDRATAVSRIWKAIQSLEAAAAAEEAAAGAQTPDVAPEAAPATNGTTGPREGSKASQVIAMLQREGGTTVEAIMAKMGWQVHTTRALLSAGGSLTKKHGLVVTSEKVGDQRVYSIKG